MVTVALTGCLARAADRKDEQPAPPERFVVSTNAGGELSGAAAKIDIKYVEAGAPPEVEVSFTASDPTGRSWSVLAQAPKEFLETLTLTAQVVDFPLTPGYASVQLGLPEQDAILAPSGRLTLRLQNGKLVGSASDMPVEFTARFTGPFVVFCAVPAAFMTTSALAPTSDAALPVLVVDEKFESLLCRRHALLATP